MWVNSTVVLHNSYDIQLVYVMYMNSSFWEDIQLNIWSACLEAVNLNDFFSFSTNGFFLCSFPWILVEPWWKESCFSFLENYLFREYRCISLIYVIISIAVDIQFVRRGEIMLKFGFEISCLGHYRCWKRDLTNVDDKSEKLTFICYTRYEEIENTLTRTLNIESLSIRGFKQFVDWTISDE